MKDFILFNCRVRAICVLSGMAAVAATSAQAADAPAKAEVKFEIPKSSFTDDYQKGKDPFFPNSKRRYPKESPQAITDRKKAEEEARKKAEEEARLKAEEEARRKAEEEAARPPDYFTELELKGVLGGRHPMATVYTGIKNYTFSANDGPQSVRIINPKNGAETNCVLQVHQIKARSIILTIDENANRRELELPVRPGS